MDKARQRRLEARERRLESLSTWTQTVETRVSEIRKAKILDKAKKIAAEQGVSLSEALDFLKKKKELKTRIAREKNELPKSKQGRVTVKVSKKGKETQNDV